LVGIPVVVSVSVSVSVALSVEGWGGTYFRERGSFCAAWFAHGAHSDERCGGELADAATRRLDALASA